MRRLILSILLMSAVALAGGGGRGIITVRGLEGYGRMEIRGTRVKVWPLPRNAQDAQPARGSAIESRITAGDSAILDSLVRIAPGGDFLNPNAIGCDRPDFRVDAYGGKRIRIGCLFRAEGQPFERLIILEKAMYRLAATCGCAHDGPSPAELEALDSDAGSVLGWVRIPSPRKQGRDDKGIGISAVDSLRALVDSLDRDAEGLMHSIEAEGTMGNPFMLEGSRRELQSVYEERRAAAAELDSMERAEAKSGSKARSEGN